MKEKVDGRGWSYRENHYHPNDEALAATRFFLGNGLIGLRGSMDELGTKGVQGLYLAGVFRECKVRQFETADTYTRKRLIFDEEIMPHPAPVQQIQGMPDILFCRIEIEGCPFRLWEGKIYSFERTLDLKTGTLTRKVDWESPGGRRVELCFERFVSWDDPRLVWQRTRVKAPAPLHLRLAPGVDSLLEPELESCRIERREDGLAFEAVCTGTGIKVDCEQRWKLEPASEGEWADVKGRPCCFYEARLDAGQTVTLERVSALSPENHPEYATLPEELAALTEAALHQGYDAAFSTSAEALTRLWEKADVVIDGPVTDQFGLRYAVYHLLAAAPWKHDHISLGAKCLSGPGYNGHVFWDNDINILPFYQWVFPKVAANHCRYRHRMLDAARALAREERRPGARYPWQSALDGAEQAPAFIRCSRTQIHVVADVPFAANRLLDIAGDEVIDPRVVGELTLECARYLSSRLEWIDERRRFECRGIGGPDEYHPVTDNNAFTLYLIDEVLARAITWAEKLPGAATPEETAAWKDQRAKLYLPIDPASGLIPQCDGFFELDEVWEEVGGNWGGIGAEFERCKALKQPDVLLLLPLLAYRRAFSESAWRRNWDYYERFILHGSSLSPSIHALVAARIGLPQRARHYFDLAAQFEFRNQNNDTQHGIHIGNCGGLWQAVVLGFAGLNEDGAGGLELAPCLPQEWRSLRFFVSYHGNGFHLRVGYYEVEVRAEADNPGAVTWTVRGDRRCLSPGQMESWQ